MTTWVFHLSFLSILGLVLDLDLGFVNVRYLNTDPCQLYMVRSAEVMPIAHTFSSVFSPHGVDVQLEWPLFPRTLDGRNICSGEQGMGVWPVHQHCCFSPERS